MCIDDHRLGEGGHRRCVESLLYLFSIMIKQKGTVRITRVVALNSRRLILVWWTKCGPYNWDHKVPSHHKEAHSQQLGSFDNVVENWIHHA